MASGRSLQKPVSLMMLPVKWVTELIQYVDDDENQHDGLGNLWGLWFRHLTSKEMQAAWEDLEEKLNIACDEQNEMLEVSPKGGCCIKRFITTWRRQLRK